MAKKRDLFSGTLSEKTRKNIERQLAESRKRDIEAMKKTNEIRAAKSKIARQKRITTNYKNAGFSDAKTGKEAHDKYTMIMDALSKGERSRVRVQIGGLFDSSGDVIEAADYIVKVKLGDKKYFSVDDLVEAMKEIQDSAFDELPYDYDPLDDLDF